MGKLLHSNNKTTLSYLGIIVVIIVWGFSPILSDIVLEGYSPALFTAIRGLLAGVSLLLISVKKLKLLNKKYFLVAVSTGLFYSVATILQNIGLKTTSPTHFQFLENLSCLVVPFLMWKFIGKKPNFLMILSCTVCLIGALILCGFGFSSNSFLFGTGDILCALAGILFGFNIAGTGAFTKDFEPSLFVMIQQFVLFLCSFVYTLVEGARGVTISYSFEIKFLILLVVESVFVSATCWLIRTFSMKYVDATVVSVMMPFTAVVTAVVSVLRGSDELSISLILGGIISLVAILLSNFGDILYRKKHQ